MNNNQKNLYDIGLEKQYDSGGNIETTPLSHMVDIKMTLKSMISQREERAPGEVNGSPLNFFKATRIRCPRGNLLCFLLHLSDCLIPGVSVRFPHILRQSLSWLPCGAVMGLAGLMP